MKNYFKTLTAVILSALLMVSFASCSDDDDTDDSAAAVMAGDYNGNLYLYVNAITTEFNDTLASAPVKVSKATDETVDITVPAMSINVEIMSMNMEIGEFVIEGVPASKVAGSDIAAKAISTSEIKSTASYSVNGGEASTREVTVSAVSAAVVNGNLELAFTWKIGSMPFDIVSTYKGKN